jgi:hypothetical protein
VGTPWGYCEYSLGVLWYSLRVLWVLPEGYCGYSLRGTVGTPWGYCEYSLLDHAAAHGHLEAVDQIVNGHLELRSARGCPHMGYPHMGYPHMGYPHGAKLTHTYVDIYICM